MRFKTRRTYQHGYGKIRTKQSCVASSQVRSRARTVQIFHRLTTSASENPNTVQLFPPLRFLLGWYSECNEPLWTQTKSTKIICSSIASAWAFHRSKSPAF